MHVPNKGKKLLRISGNFIYLTKEKGKYDSPTGFCMFLRKKLTSGRIREVKQIDSERVVNIEIETKDEKFNLIVELFGKGNLILLKDNKILSAIEYKKWKDRTIKPNELYKSPRREYNFFKLTEKTLKELLGKSNKENLVKSLALELGLGGIYSEEICLRLNIDKNNKPSQVKDIKKILKEIKKITKEKISAQVVKGDIIPFNLKVYEKEKKELFKSYNEALDYVLSKQVIQPQMENKEITKLKRIIVDQEKTIKKLKNSEKENKEKGETIYNNYQIIKEILLELKKARKKFSFKEIKEKLKKHEVVKEVNSKEKSVIVEIK